MYWIGVCNDGNEDGVGFDSLGFGVGVGLWWEWFVCYGILDILGVGIGRVCSVF